MINILSYIIMTLILINMIILMISSVIEIKRSKKYYDKLYKNLEEYYERQDD